MAGSPLVIEKANLTVTPPGGSTLRFAIIQEKTTPLAGFPATKRTPLPSTLKRYRHQNHYDMYRKHPILRAAVDKVAKTAVASGFSFVPEDNRQNLNEERAKELRQFFRRSNGIALLRLTYKDCLVFSESYWWIERPKVGNPIRARRLNPRYVDWVVENGEVIGVNYGAGATTKDPQFYSIDDIIPFRIEDLESDIHGLPPFDSLEQTVAADLFMMAFNGAFFENSAQTGIVFVMKDSSEGEIKRNRAWLEENYVGTRNAHKPLLLEGDIEVKSAVTKPQDMQFIEGRKLNRAEILAVLDVPPDKLGITETSNRSTGKEADNGFRTETIAPLQAVVEEPVNNILIMKMFGWDDVLFRHNEVSPRDELANLQMLTDAEMKGVFSPNDVRASLGRGPVKGGDTYFVQTAAGLIPLDTLKALAETQLANMQAGLNAGASASTAPGSPNNNPGGPGSGPVPHAVGLGQRPAPTPKAP